MDEASEDNIEQRYTNNRRGNPECEKCGELKKHIDEPMMSGFRGYLCTNDDCVLDS